MRNFMEAYNAVHSSEAREELSAKRDEIAEMDLSMINDEELEDLCEEALGDLLDEGYTVEECEAIFTTVITEAKVTFGHDTAGAKAKKTDRLERGLKSAIGKVKSKAAKGAVKAYGAYRDAKASAKMKARRAGQTTKNMSAQAQRKGSEMKAKAKSGLKSMIKKGAKAVAKGALGVAKRMSEGMHRDAKTGEVVDKAEVGKTYYPNMPKKKTSVALRKEKMKEGLDPVGKEDKDIDNDGDHDKSDKYLLNRRKAIGKAMGKKMKKEEVEQVDELYKGKHGQTEKQYQDGRSDAGKMISGDSKGSGANYSYKAKNTGPNPAGGSKKPQGQARMGSKDREYLKFRKAELKKKMGESFTDVELDRIIEVVDSWED